MTSSALTPVVSASAIRSRMRRSTDRGSTAADSATRVPAAVRVNALGCNPHHAGCDLETCTFLGNDGLGCQEGAQRVAAQDSPGDDYERRQTDENGYSVRPAVEPRTERVYRHIGHGNRQKDVATATISRRRQSCCNRRRDQGEGGNTDAQQAGEGSEAGPRAPGNGQDRHEYKFSDCRRPHACHGWPLLPAPDRRGR